MKKNLLNWALALGVGFLSTANAQVTFESHPLGAESYDKDAGVAGAFVFNDISFSNFYDSGWDFWTGFSISNVTDNTTAGYGNQFGVYPGSGNASSSNFAVFYPEGAITCSAGRILSGFYITNTTYAAIAMRDGDAYSKQFGSPLDASGNPDGTNGEDFFRVWIIGEDDGLTQRDSVEFYLADYRFADNGLDYIVDTWEYVDLSSFSFEVSKVSFLFESSDVGSWGINTPTYFAIDDVQYETLSISDLNKNPFSVYPNPASEVFTISGFEGSYALLNAQGQVVREGSIENEIQLNVAALPQGMYVLTLKDGSRTYTERIMH